MELETARLEAAAYRLRMEETADERAVLEAEIGRGMVSMEASMKRIRSALVKGAATPDDDATGTTAPETTGTLREARGASRSGIGSAKPAVPDAEAPPASVGPEGRVPRPEAAPETVPRLERTRRTGRASQEEPGIGAGSVPPEVDAGTEAIVLTGEFPDRGGADVSLLGEALAALAAKTDMTTGDTAGSGSKL